MVKYRKHLKENISYGIFYFKTWCAPFVQIKAPDIGYLTLEVNVYFKGFCFI